MFGVNQDVRTSVYFVFVSVCVHNQEPTLHYGLWPTHVYICFFNTLNHYVKVNLLFINIFFISIAMLNSDKQDVFNYEYSVGESYYDEIICYINSTVFIN